METRQLQRMLNLLEEQKQLIKSPDLKLYPVNQTAFLLENLEKLEAEVLDLNKTLWQSLAQIEYVYQLVVQMRRMQNDRNNNN